MGMIKEYKKFAIKGNMIDMAVGIIIGAAFTTVVKSLVDDIAMPFFGMLIGGVDFADFFIVLGDGSFENLAAAKEAGAATMNYGLFINSIIAFLIVSWVLFLVIKSINELKEEDTPVKATEKECGYCFSKISIKATKCAHCASVLNE